MSFITFSLDFYTKELQRLESSCANEQSIYHAKQLLKMLDDLADEGYTELNEKLENLHHGVSRLKKYLKDNQSKPFAIYQKPINEEDITYEQREIELTEAINEFMVCAEKSKKTSDNPFLSELSLFCEWVGYEENTAYIFLLRDTLLPYIYYKSKGRKNIYPWLIGRKTLTTLANKENVDDEIRASIINALEFGNCHNYKDFCKTVLPDIRNTISQYPKIEECLFNLLNKIKEKRIVVVESGCSGTFPMLLCSLDERVDVRMYTTYPYLLKTYGDKIFSPKYEENRLFETLYSQDLYFQFSNIKNGHSYVKKCQNKEVEQNAFAEVKTFLG